MLIADAGPHSRAQKLFLIDFSNLPVRAQLRRCQRRAKSKIKINKIHRRVADGQFSQNDSENNNNKKDDSSVNANCTQPN
jgi:hypothetical protein